MENTLSLSVYCSLFLVHCSKLFASIMTLSFWLEDLIAPSDSGHNAWQIMLQLKEAIKDNRIVPFTNSALHIFLFGKICSQGSCCDIGFLVYVLLPSSFFLLFGIWINSFLCLCHHHSTLPTLSNILWKHTGHPRRLKLLCPFILHLLSVVEARNTLPYQNLTL